jgi:hypothetical protein
MFILSKKKYPHSKVSVFGVGVGLGVKGMQMFGVLLNNSSWVVSLSFG